MHAETEYNNKSKITYVTEDVEFLGKEYEVRLTDGTKLNRSMEFVGIDD